MMEDALHSLFKICVLIGVPFTLGLASRVWWEVKFFLLFVFGCVFFGVLLRSMVFGQDAELDGNIQNVITYTMIFTPLGYAIGTPIVKYFSARLEQVLASDEFDETYRKHAKRHKTYFANDDKDAFQDFYRTYQNEKTGSSGSSYEQYSQSRRSQTRHERTPPPPPQDYRSDKDKMFDILEVSDRNASPKDLKSVYRKLAWKYHPDVLAKNELSDADLKKAEARMQDINQAYDWLKDNGYAV